MVATAATIGTQRHHSHWRIRAELRPAKLGPQAVRRFVLSHDFVEAALMRRTGWKVRMITDCAVLEESRHR